MRYFDTGATRDSDDGKLDFEGFFSPYAMYRFAEYMHQHRHQADGHLRASDNWQKGIPQEAYMKSLFRHFMELWLRWRDKCDDQQAFQDALCAILFNAQGLLHERVHPSNAPAEPQVSVSAGRSLRAHLGRGCGLAYDNLGNEGLLLDADERRKLWEAAHHPVDRRGRVSEQERW